MRPVIRLDMLVRLVVSRRMVMVERGERQAQEEHLTQRDRTLRDSEEQRHERSLGAVAPCRQPT